MASNEKRTTAESRFARTQKRAAEATQAMKEAEAESRRVTDNTARLKALRLAREAADLAEAAANPPAKAKRKSRAKAPARSIAVENLNAKDDV
jgi:hypothetical protein